MSPGSCGGSWSEPIILTEEEIFSRPIDNPPWGGDVFGDGANDIPLALQWGDCETEDFESFTNQNSALGGNVHSNSFHPHMHQPAFESQQVVAPVDPSYIPHSVQSRSNEGGLEGVVQECHRRQRQRQAAASLASNETPHLLWFRRAYKNSAPALRRRPPGSSPTWYSMEGRGRATGKVSKRSPVHRKNTKTPVYPQCIQSVLKHPFHIPTIPPIIARSGMYSLEYNNAGTIPRPSSAPEVLCTLPTTTRINPVQDQVFTMAPVHPQYGPLVSSGSDFDLMPVVSLPPIRALLDPFKAFDEISTALTTTTLNRVQPEQAISLMADLPFEPLMDADFECQPVTFYEPDCPSPSSDWSMRGSMEDVDLWDHSSIASPPFPEQAPEPVQGPCRGHDIPVVTDAVAYLADSVTYQAAATDVPSPVLSMDPPKPENQHCRVPRSLKGMVLEAKSPRLKWIPELHDKFVAAVTSLGGPDVATPKAVLRTMDCGAEVHVFHVKSHLQKYRLQNLYSPTGTKQHHPCISEQITLDLGETSEVQNDIEARLHQSIEVDMETSQNVAMMNKQLERTIAAQETQMEQLEQMKRILEYQQAIRASSADQPTSSSEASALEFKVQVPRLVIVATECAVIYSSDDEE